MNVQRRKTDLPATAYALRQKIRAGQFCGQTSGKAFGLVQGNVVILPRSFADDFQSYCERNPKPCSILAVSRSGDWRLPELGHDIDIRTDVPAYRVHRQGELVGEVSDLLDLWQDDFVTFVLGCSFSFEEALIEAGLSIRHIELGRNVPMYRTNIETVPAGCFAGPLVVSMRPFTVADTIRAIEITSRFPSVHGAPIHFGAAAEIGIPGLQLPDYGDAPEMRPGELPVFWACGVTPQIALERAKPMVCITHAPGHMLVTDLLNSSLANA